MRIVGEQPDEVHLVGWDGPIDRLDIRWAREADGSDRYKRSPDGKPVAIDPTWGQRIAEAAKSIVSGNPTVPTRESVSRGEHTINQYRAYHGITDEYPVRMSRDPDNPSHIHQFPAKEPQTVPHQYLPCACGKSLGEGHDDGPETRRA
jgi:hypothetical protein